MKAKLQILTLKMLALLSSQFSKWEMSLNISSSPLPSVLEYSKHIITTAAKYVLQKKNEIRKLKKVESQVSKLSDARLPSLF